MNIPIDFSGYNRLVVSDIDSDNRVVGTLQLVTTDADGLEVVEKQEAGIGFPIPNDYFSLTDQEIADFKNPPVVEKPIV